jgi:hypothetical protein
MGSFFAKETTPVHVDIKYENLESVVASLKQQFPESVITTVALKDDDEYSPRKIGADHFIVTYDALTGQVYRVYCD